uniref:Glycosyltransferase family 92 protein n=1 Tax=Panagrolaimus sp. ES5 TaxID=591445 RepID=A0AC34FST7_9BILA
MLEVRSRNQNVAYTDCLMKYRESSDFVIIADVDDILFPKSGSYFKDFSAWSKLHPSAAAFMYDRRFAQINVAKYIQQFSLYDTMKSLVVLNETVIGKSVYQTKNAETAWIHFPGLHNETTISIPNEKIFHVQIKSMVSIFAHLNYT